MYENKEIPCDFNMPIGSVYEEIALKYFEKIYDDIDGFSIETIFDLNKAVRYFELAVESGHENARYNYELCVAQKEKSIKEAKELI